MCYHYVKGWSHTGTFQNKTCVLLVTVHMTV